MMSDDAYPWYAQGLAIMMRPFAHESLPSAMTYFQEAMLLDDGSAVLHAALGECYYQMATFSKHTNKREYIDLAARSAQRAIDLAPDFGFPYSIIATQRFLSADMVGGLDMAFKAFDLAPDNADVAMRLGYLLAAVGKTRQAIPFFELAVSLEPAQGRNLQCLSQAKLCNDEFEDAEIYAKKAIDLQYFFAFDTYAAVAYAKGDHALAGKRFLQACQAMYHLFGEEYGLPDAWQAFPELVYSPDTTVRATMARRLYELGTYGEDEPSIPLMTVAIRTGAAEVLFDASLTGPPLGSHGVLLRIWGGVDTCRMIYEHPKFAAFAQRIGMTAAWEKYGMPDRLT
jgi:tetratricopeptide (TPR) repeat protein